ncbi:MAG: methyltransferase domain-containing protein [Pseudomonadota bacterium]
MESAHLNWLNSPYGESYIEAETAHVNRALRQITGPRVLQMGSVINAEELLALDFPQLILVHDSQNMTTSGESQRVFADAAFLPFDAGSLSSVILPHVLESHSLPHQVLREAHRVLMPEGHLILTGFNPASLMGVQRFLRPAAVYKGQYYTVKRVKDWMQLLRFELVASAMFQYAPLVKKTGLRNALNFINSVGDRWLPMTGGGYMISAKKREAGMRMVGKVRFSSAEKRRRKLAAATARKPVCHHHNRK